MPSPRLLVVLVALLAALGGAYLWLRDSSLVAVKRVTVVGVSGADAARIRNALNRAGRSMTTLDVHEKALNMAVAPFPVVKGLEVSTQFPHGMTIRVIEEVPVGVLVSSGAKTAVAADGTLLHDVPAPKSLPEIPLPATPGGSRITDKAAAEAVKLLAAAPYKLLGKVRQVTLTNPMGLVAELRNGPELYFGSANQLREKWQAVAAVLADPGSVGAVYIDVTDPSRPAAGSGTDHAPPANNGNASAAASATSAGGGTTATGAGTTSSGAGTTATAAGAAATAAGAAPAAAGATDQTGTAAAAATSDQGNAGGAQGTSTIGG
jgi:cell division protein FtsQ